MTLKWPHSWLSEQHLRMPNYYNLWHLAGDKKSAQQTVRYLHHLYIVGSEISTLLCWSGNTPTMKQPYNVRSPVASDALLSALDGPPCCCRLLKLSYTCWRTAFNCVHTLSFRHHGIQVFSTRLTGTCLYNDYTDNHMTQRFHTSRWKIPHVSFCKQVFSTWTYYCTSWNFRASFIFA